MIPTKKKRQHSEDDTCIEFVKIVQTFQNLTSNKFVFFHIPNEISANNNPIFGAKLKRMGKLAGVPDYCFLWNKSVGFIEFKAKKGVLSDAQKSFKDDMEDLNIKFAVAYTSNEGVYILKEWGLLPNINI